MPLLSMEAVLRVMWVMINRGVRGGRDRRLSGHGQDGGVTRQLPIQDTQKRSTDRTYLRNSKLENCVTYCLNVTLMPS